MTETHVHNNLTIKRHGKYKEKFSCINLHTYQHFYHHLTCNKFRTKQVDRYVKRSMICLYNRVYVKKKEKKKYFGSAFYHLYSFFCVYTKVPFFILTQFFHKFHTFFLHAIHSFSCFTFLRFFFF